MCNDALSFSYVDKPGANKLYISYDCTKFIGLVNVQGES